LEDVVINPYTQVLLASIGTALIGAVGALWIIVWKLVGEKDNLYKEHSQRMESLVDRYHNFAVTIERAIKG